ncbi:unnamed protein product [Parnassius apollo]|uniref:(apollo) hypothetical protein n=1 Tax=Parnassius apollo TaxID=110799 RepID=A0A8S3WIR3_PARAO|nr:unnamed protein product [Parnassius apollo]
MASESPERLEPQEALSAAQRARIERNRQRARALKEARIVHRSPTDASEGIREISVGKTRALDTGGGFLLEEDVVDAPAPHAARPAPLVHRTEQPRCLECDRLFPQSYLFDTFDYSVCDECRDEEAHALVTRTEAKSEFLLQDCDLDSREPALRCVRRRNPHRARFAEMRLYVRAQVEARALAVWGSAERLQEEREARRTRRQLAEQRAAARRLRALRMDVRSSLFDRTHAPHEHRFADEVYAADAAEYSRTCLDCGHVQTYEKM